MFKICQKCNHPNASATGGALDACPECGAIYSKVAAAMAPKSSTSNPVEPAPQTFARARPFASARDADVDVGTFAKRMRAESLYPTFRGLVGLIYAVWVVLAVLALLGALMALWSGTGVTRVGGFIGGAFFAVFFFVIAKVTREAALMLADLSDAAVRMASRE